ncbi:MAG TPA: L-threonylcarbamoyladenylate synthase [Thermoplasmata archaeon]|jgi:L-threonylcarbamoyladenylate synthase|nr:L-threonylcarbamoyladenylate synthase [Thermoplasmata archaeon]
MDASLDDAVRALADGAIVAYPTDTLVGLAVRATDRAAVDRLARTKRRADRQPISIALSSIDEIEPLGRLSVAGRRFVRRQLPGPFTVLVRPTARARRTLADAVAGGAAIGLRVPDHPVARALARRAGPITATSANRHGAPPARTVAEARATFGAEVAVYVDGGPRGSGRPSTLVDLTAATPREVVRR